MFHPYSQPIDAVGFLYAHSGLKADRGNRIYSIAAAVLRADRPLTTFDSLVHYSELTGRERYYSNVSKEILSQAPLPNAVMEKLKLFLADVSIFFVYNDHDNMEEILKFCGPLRIVDLSFAAEFFLPQLESYSSKRLWEYLSGKVRNRISFKASEIVHLEIDLVKHICSVQLHDTLNPQAAAIRYYLKQGETLFGEVFLHLTRNCRKYFGGLFNTCTKPDTDNWKQFLQKALPAYHEEISVESYQKIGLSTVEDLYRSLSASGKGYKERKEQVEYARHIVGAINDQAFLCLEAGTGTGKTLGYLLPALEFLRRNKNMRIAISTYTKNLQEQIFQREMFYTRSYFKLYRDIHAAIVKGKSSYICTVKLDHVYETEMKGPNLLTWLYFLNLVYHFHDADIDSVGPKIKYYLNNKGNFSRMLNEISSKNGCNSQHLYCAAQVMTNRARQARLIITNHHKLALLDQDPILSGLFRIYIIDEANHFEDAVRSAFRIEVGTVEITDTLGYLVKTVRKIFPKAAGEQAKALNDFSVDMQAMQREMIRLHSALITIHPKAESGEMKELPLSHEAFKNGHIQYHLNTLQDILERISSSLKFFNDPDTCRILKIRRRTAARIKTAISHLNEYASSLNMISESILLQNTVTSYQVFNKQWTLTAQNVEVTNLIRKYIYADKDCIIYTAATLSNKHSFESFSKIVGMDTPLPSNADKKISREFRFQSIPSPFAQNAMEIIVPDNAVNGRFSNKKDWLDFVVAVLPELIKKNRGRSLVLFSSYSDLNLIAERVSETINNSMYPLLIQQKGCSTVNLCDEFRNIKESVLFGVDTFWHGVDFKGDTLTQVIITRLPYPSPQNPIQMARKRLMPVKDYWKRYHYDVGIKMKQGIGRLIRSDTDRGKVIILDSRYRPQ